MSATRYASVLGLGFGDCGKGHFVDSLTRRWRAHTVVRFNGGAQAGHNVVTSPEGNLPARHHTFSQFGAGTLVPGVRTVLINPMIVHPTAFLVEAEALAKVGVTDALSRLIIDAQCRITTPFHQAAGRLRELMRGAKVHGTCGVGVGETVRHSLNYPEQTLRYSDFAQLDASSLLDRLQAIRKTLLAEILPHCTDDFGSALETELRVLRDETVASKWMTGSLAVARHCPPASLDEIRFQLTQTGCVLFEGAQGVLLDEWRGFHPHTTWSTINVEAVELVAARFAIETTIEHYGVLRTYLTRHGAGPFPTHDESLDELLPEPHNGGDGWQGCFRRGHPDAVLLRYALEAAGRLSGLLISHLDVFERGVTLKWCERYAVARNSTQCPEQVDRLPVGRSGDLHHQGKLTQLLENVRPQFATNIISSGKEYLDHISKVTTLPIKFRSYGPTSNDVHEI